MQLLKTTCAWLYEQHVKNNTALSPFPSCQVQLQAFFPSFLVWTTPVRPWKPMSDVKLFPLPTSAPGRIAHFPALGSRFTRHRVNEVHKASSERSFLRSRSYLDTLQLKHLLWLSVTKDLLHSLAAASSPRLCQRTLHSSQAVPKPCPNLGLKLFLLCSPAQTRLSSWNTSPHLPIEILPTLQGLGLLVPWEADGSQKGENFPCGPSVPLPMLSRVYGFGMTSMVYSIL